jgi:transcriptional regulator with XRE-family HTH domain
MYLGRMKAKSVATRIQSLRRAAGFSQSGLAKAAGIPVGTIKNWEQGIRTPRLDMASKVCKALKVSLDQLVCNHGTVKKLRRKRGSDADA